MAPTGNAEIKQSNTGRGFRDPQRAYAVWQNAKVSRNHSAWKLRIKKEFSGGNNRIPPLSFLEKRFFVATMVLIIC